MTILQAHKFYWYRDGASNYALQLAELLEKDGHASIPFAMMHPSNLPTPFERFFVSNMELGNPSTQSLGQKISHAGRFIYSFEAKRNIARLLNEYPVDVVHLHNIYHHISPSILPEIKKRGIPIVMTVHDFKLLSPNYTLFHHNAIHEEDARGWYVSCLKNKCVKDSRAQSALATAEMIWHHKIMRYYERFVDHFISPSQFVTDLCARHGWPREKFTHIPHPSRMQSAELRMQDGDAVVYAGRLSPEKGLLVLLEAAAKTPRIPYVIVGDGPQGQELKNIVAQKKLSNVTFTGFQTGAALAGLIGSARLLVLPAVWYEIYPLSILEGKAMEKVVIGTKLGGVTEMLPPELLVEPGNADELAKRIAEWYDTPAENRRRMGQRLALEVEKENNPTEHVRRIEDIYRLVCAKKSS